MNRGCLVSDGGSSCLVGLDSEFPEDVDLHTECTRCEYCFGQLPKNDYGNPPASHIKAINFHKQEISTTEPPRLALWRPSIDNITAPTLAAKSLDLQTREIFNTMVSTILFPATYAAFYKRVDQDITAFVRDDQRAQCPAMEWMVRCYVTWYIAKRNNDNERLDQSRYIYGVLLRYLRGILDHPRQRQSDVAVVIAVLLVLYELFDESSPEAWLVHLKGVKELLRQRGANVHLKGFSRTLLLTCRGFFIAEAFAMQEDCFLAESAWMAVSKKAFEREERAGRGCRLVSLIDKAYREIVRVPGLVVQVRSVMGSGCELRNDDGVGGWSSREEIRAKIQRSLAVLRRLRRSFTCAAELDVTPGRVADLDSNSEPLIDVRYLPEIARYNLHGVCAVEGLLDRLIETLGDENNGTSVQRGSGGRVAISERIRRDTTAIVKSGRTLGSSLLAGGSMDDMFLTMGAMAIGTAT